MARTYKRDSRGRFAGGGGGSSKVTSRPRVKSTSAKRPSTATNPKPVSSAQQKAAARRKTMAARQQRVQKVNRAIQYGIIAAPFVARAAIGAGEFRRGYRTGRYNASVRANKARAANAPYRAQSHRVVLRALTSG